jgi:hypothetical protein
VCGLTSDRILAEVGVGGASACGLGGRRELASGEAAARLRPHAAQEAEGTTWGGVEELWPEGGGPDGGAPHDSSNGGWRTSSRARGEGNVVL